MKYFIALLFLAASFNSHADCDYSEADQNWGYGWDADTQTSCPPLETPSNADFCDYQDAANNRGYGYNAATNESCPPIGQTVFYSVLNSTQLEASGNGLLVLQQKEAFCTAGDRATGGGCAFNPLQTAKLNGWIITGTTTLNDDSWNCAFSCSGQINADGTHSDSCPATQVSAKVMCVGKQ